VVGDEQRCQDDTAGHQAGDAGDVTDARQRMSGQSARAQRRRQPRHAHHEDPGGKGPVAHPGTAGYRRHRRGEPGRGPAAPGGLLLLRPPRTATAPPSGHHGTAEERQLIARHDRDDDRDRDGERRAPGADQRASQQGHSPARQQDGRNQHDLRDDGHAEGGDGRGGRQRVQRGKERRGGRHDRHHRHTITTTSM